jgi:hypothetical protein
MSVDPVLVVRHVFTLLGQLADKVRLTVHLVMVTKKPEWGTLPAKPSLLAV